MADEKETPQREAQREARREERQERREMNEARDRHEAAAKEQEIEPHKLAPAGSADPDDLYEVMVDQWGHAPAFERGQLITRAMAHMYDVDWALANGTLRKAPEYAGRNMRSTTELLS